MNRWLPRASPSNSHLNRQRGSGPTWIEPAIVGRGRSGHAALDTGGHEYVAERPPRRTASHGFSQTARSRMAYSFATLATTRPAATRLISGLVPIRTTNAIGGTRDVALRLSSRRLSNTHGVTITHDGSTRSGGRSIPIRNSPRTMCGQSARPTLLAASLSKFSPTATAFIRRSSARSFSAKRGATSRSSRA